MSHRILKKLSVLILKIGILFASSSWVLAAPVSSSLNCNKFEQIASLFENQISSILNEEIAGYAKRLNRRKTFRINGVDSLSFDGCNATVIANISLLRKWRRNAHGSSTVIGDISAKNGGNNTTRICLSNGRVTKLKLSRTTRLGEAVYKLVANKVIPDNFCFSLPVLPEIFGIDPPDIIISTCNSAIQGKIAWDYNGNTLWNPSNIDRLCEGAENTEGPAQCFDTVMHGGINWGGGTRWYWGNAVNLCKGTSAPDITIDCFVQEINDGQEWPVAINACTRSK
jgi:hypothetical protein